MSVSLGRIIEEIAFLFRNKSAIAPEVPSKTMPENLDNMEKTVQSNYQGDEQH
ncbi:MAG: hypothetical protein RMY34_00520 [Aulosira sp. DedQUE10]|nr:hypothetical protein [Aulosira sp. DedQUE10]